MIDKIATTQSVATFTNKINEVIEDVNAKAKVDLSNLNEDGENRLHALKGYEDAGELLIDKEGVNDVISYAHSTFDASKFTVVGSPTITSDGIFISDTDQSRYPKVNLQSIPDNFVFTEFVKYSNYTSGQGVANVFGFYMAVAYGYIYLFDASHAGLIQETIPSLSSLVTTGIYVRLTVNTVNNQKLAYCSWSTDGVLWDETNSVDITSHPFSGNSIIFGSDGYWTWYNVLECDLKKATLISNGVPVFSGNKTGIDTIKPDDYTLVGSPTISDDGVLNQATASNYLTTPTISFSNANDVDIQMRIYLLGDHCYVFDGGSGTRFEPYNLSYGGYPAWSVLSFNEQFAMAITELLPENQWITLKLYYRGADSYAQILENGSFRTLNSTIILNNSFSFEHTINIGTFQGHSANCNIDLNSLKIYIDDSLVYQPCLKIPYTESKTGSKIVDNTYLTRVNDMYSQFGYAPYYTLEETYVPKYTKVGSPTITSDYIASGFTGSDFLRTIQCKDLTNKSWEIKGRFQFNSSITYDGVFSLCASWLNWGSIAVTSSSFAFVGKFGDSADISAEGLGIAFNFTFANNAWYRYRLTFDYSIGKYTLTLLDDNGNFLQEGYYTPTVTNKQINAIATASTDYMIIGYCLGWYTATIQDLKEFSIESDGKVLYRAVQPPCFTLPQGELYGLMSKAYSTFKGATSGAAGTAGLVPAPASGDTSKYLKSDGTWATVSASSTLGGLTDVTITSATNGQVLSYNGTGWVNSNPTKITFRDWS